VRVLTDTLGRLAHDVATACHHTSE
jgi:hypothetical protein